MILFLLLCNVCLIGFDLGFVAGSTCVLSRKPKTNDDISFRGSDEDEDVLNRWRARLEEGFIDTGHEIDQAWIDRQIELLRQEMRRRNQ